MAKVIYLKTGLGGLDPVASGLLQVAALVEIDGALKDGAYWKVMPVQGKQYSDEAVAYNGFTQVTPDFKDPVDVHRELSDFVLRHVDKFDKADKAVIAGWAPRLDDDALAQLFKDRGDQFYRSLFWTPSIDVQSIAAQVFIDHRASVPDFKLDTVAERYGIRSTVPKADARSRVCTVRRLHHRLMNRPDPGAAPWGV